MVRDDLELRIGVHDFGEHEARQRDAGLERPAEHAADFILRLLLADVVRHFASVRRMQQDRLAGFFDHLVERPEFLAVDRLAVDVGVKLDGIGSVAECALSLLGRGVRRVHRHHRGITNEAVGMLRDHLGKPVVCELTCGACSTNGQGHDDVMPIRSFRGSGEPVWVVACSNARDGLGPDPRTALRPAAHPPRQQAGHVTAPDQCCSNVKKFLPGRRPHVTRSGPRVFNAAQLQLHALAFNLGNFLRTLVTQDPSKDWSLTSLTRS